MWVNEPTTVDSDTRRKFTSPEARVHEQDYIVNILLLVVRMYICGIADSILLLQCCVLLKSMQVP